jgi:hypothetical protein
MKTVGAILLLGGLLRVLPSPSILTAGPTMLTATEPIPTNNASTHIPIVQVVRSTQVGEANGTTMSTSVANRQSPADQSHRLSRGLHPRRQPPISTCGKRQGHLGSVRALPTMSIATDR